MPRNLGDRVPGQLFKRTSAAVRLLIWTFRPNYSSDACMRGPGAETKKSQKLIQLFRGGAFQDRKELIDRKMGLLPLKDALGKLGAARKAVGKIQRF